MFSRNFLAGCALMASSANSANATIDIRRADIAQGTLQVRGQVTPVVPTVTIEINTKVSVQVQTDAQGNFYWSGVTFPDSCLIKLTAGADKKDALVERCGLRGPEGPAGANGTNGGTTLRFGSPNDVRPFASCKADETIVSGYCGTTGLLAKFDSKSNSVYCTYENGPPVVLCAKKTDIAH